MTHLKIKQIQICLLGLFTVLTLSCSQIPVASSHKTYELTYQVELQQPKNAEFKNYSVWIPYPTESLEQQVLSKKITSPVPFKITKEATFGNRMIHLELPSQTKFPVMVTAKYKIKRHNARTTPLKSFKDHDMWVPNKFLSMNKKVPITGIIADIANKQTAGLTSPKAKIDKLYDYVVNSMSYDKSGTGWGEGDAVWACSAKRGNCTDFHSLFVGLARSQEIPARFEIGLPIPPSGKGNIPGYHCWARVFDTATNWIPLDASESKKINEPRKYFGFLPNNRIHFSTGRDLTLVPAQKSESLNYFIYPHVEVDGVKSDSYKKEFSIVTLL